MQQTVLSDKNKRGKERPWLIHKKSSRKIVELLYLIGEPEKAKRMYRCASEIVFKVLEDGSKKLVKGLFCQIRICPMCSWRKSRFIYAQFILVAHRVIEKYPTTQFIFLTLTLKNCVAADLSKTIDHFLKSFKKLLRHNDIETSTKGFFRALEVTYNPQEKTYNVHIHCVVAVLKSYFTSRNYLNQERWTELWQWAAGIKYTPIVDVRKVRPKKKKGLKTIYEDLRMSNQELQKYSILQGGAEVAKYPVKTVDIINPQEKPTDTSEMIDAKRALKKDINWQGEVIDKYMSALHRRRLIAYTGVFQDASRELKCEDVEKSNLINAPGEEDDCNCNLCKTEIVQLQYYIFTDNNYVLSNQVIRMPTKQTGDPIYTNKYLISSKGQK